MFSFKYVTKYIKNLLLLFFIIEITHQILVFPLKTFRPINFTSINNSHSFSKEDFLNYWLPNEMYTYLNVGSPPSKVYTFIDSENYGSYMDNSICQLPSKYNNDSSSTFTNTSNYIVSFSHFSNMCFAKETFSAYTTFDLNESRRKILNNMTFLYAIKPYNDTLYSKFYSDVPITGFSCFHIGLQLPISLDYYDCWIKQLKKSDYIETTYWTIEFNNNKKGLFDIYNNEDEYEGNLVIGLPPHKFNPNKYKEDIFRSTVSKVRYKNYEDYRVNLWGIIFDKIYFISNNSTKDEIILQSTKCKFSLDINLIEGSTNYLNNIEQEFFNELYNKSICYKERIKSEKNGLYYMITCDKNYYEEMKNFPTLYFKSNELDYIFELTYKDLFSINGDKIFFMVIFRSREAMFTFGKLFYKKYLFTFSFDNKIIGFYNDKISIEKKNYFNDDKILMKRKIFIILICIVIAFVLIIVFIKVKKNCLSERQKRMNELIDDNYVYMINKAKNNSSENIRNISLGINK